MMQVTDGCEAMNFSASCPQLAASMSAAQAGSGLPRTAANSAPSSNGRVTSTATPRAAGGGRGGGLRRRARDRGVVELHAIEAIALERARKLGVRAHGVMCDTDIADAARLPPGV